VAVAVLSAPDKRLLGAVCLNGWWRSNSINNILNAKPTVDIGIFKSPPL
jgi:hypothetical protein